MNRVCLAAVFRLAPGAIGLFAAIFITAAPCAFAQVNDPAKKPAPKPADDDLYEGPAKPAKPVLKPVLPANTTPSAGPKFADAWPSEYRVAEADLGLDEVAENRARAMAEFVRASQAEARGDADEALEGWKRAATLDPANADLAVKVAFELAKRNEPGDAIRILKDSIAAAPKEPRTHIYLSQIYAKHLNKPDLALAAAQKAVEVAPDSFLPWAAVYELHEQAGDKIKTAAWIDHGLKSQTKDADYWLRLGAYLWKPEEDSDAKPGSPLFKQAEIAFRKAAELRPEDAAVLAQTGDLYTRVREHRQALDFYARAVKLNQPSRHPSTEDLRVKYAESLYINDRRAEALREYEQIAADPSQAVRPGVTERLAELYIQTGQPDKAIDMFQHSLVLDTAAPTNHIRLAFAQRRAKRWDDALATLDKARKKFRDQPNLDYIYASTLTAAKRHDEALKLFEGIEEKAKGRAEQLLDDEFYNSWAYAAERAGQFDKAVGLLKKSIAMEPEKPGAYNDLGYMWVERGLNLDEAGVMIKKAVEMAPTQSAYLDSLGWYYFKVGKFEEAKIELLKALENAESEDDTMYDHLGDVYEKLGNLREAISHWDRALKFDPDEPEKIRAKLEAARKKQAEK